MHNNKENKYILLKEKSAKKERKNFVVKIGGRLFPNLI